MYSLLKHLNHSLLRRWFAVLSLAGLMTCTVRGEPEPMPISPDYGFSWQMTMYAKDAGLDQQRVFDVAFGQDGAVWLAAAGFSGRLTDHPQVMEQGNIRRIVQKPFSSQEILQLIADLLDCSKPN